MRFVDNENIADPRLNLAIEEHLLRNMDLTEPILLFYINEPSVIIGRNQNTIEEIDLDYVKSRGIHVVRRLSGGGAVYHDLGNLNFSFITQGKEGLHDFARFTDPVIDVLRRLGVTAELRGKSDIFAGDKKISGNAQYSAAGRMFSHGTLLFDTNLEEMLKALNPRKVQIESKAVQSIRNFVINIRELLDQDMDIYSLKQSILQGIFGDDLMPAYQLTPADWNKIQAISDQRYREWDWNYGRSPDFNIQKSDRLPAGKFDVRIEVIDGYIDSLRIYGDFAGLKDVAELEQHLVGVRYERETLADSLELVDIQPYFGDLNKADFLNLLY